jgi:5-methylcytosine-specific restriction protein A
MSNIDNLQITHRGGQLYRRIAVKPYIRADASTTELATWESGCAECGEVFEVVTTARVRKLRGPNRPIEPFYSSPEWRALVRELIAVRGRRYEDPRCEAPNLGTDQKLYGDHIHELVDGGAPLDAANVMLRCAPCHGRKTAQWAGKASKPMEGMGVICQMPTGARNRTDAHAQTARPAAFKKLGGNE